MKYNSDILRQLHVELHDILGEVCRVCDKASIPYFIQGGTAIDGVTVSTPKHGQHDNGAECLLYAKYCTKAS